MVDHVDAASGLGATLPDPYAEVFSPVATAPAQAATLSRGAMAWAAYEGGRTPYVILVTIYIFTPYFATVMVGDPVRGQALVARIAMGYGLFAAATAPLFGAAMDRIGARKPWLAIVTAAMIALMASLWWARPDGSGLSVLGVSLVLATVGVLFSYSEVLHNSLLTYAAAPSETATASGMGLALGNFAAMLMLVFVLWAFALPGRLPLPFLPPAPLFGLGAIPHGADRIVGPLVAVVFTLAALPVFLVSRDAPKGAGGGVAASFTQLFDTLRALKTDRRMALFLGSRMIYTDGMTSILFFTGVLAAGVMGWKVLDLLAMGIVMSIAATVGGLLATRLDALFGAKRAIQLQLATVIVCEAIMLGITPHRLFYMPYSGAPLWQGPVFKTVPEVVFLCLGCINALGVCGSYASSRVMLTRLCTPERAGGWFGLYALSGTVTLWLGSMLVGIATHAFKNQQAGFIPIAVLLVVGLIGLSFVRGRGRLGEA